MKKIFFFLFFLFSPVLNSEEVFHNFKVIDVIDGDTVKIEANYLPKPLAPELKLRITGIDTPEKGSRAKCDLEKKKAEEATIFLKKIIENEKFLKVSFIKWDKFGGRVIGDILTSENRRVSEIMIENGLAQPYFGSKKTNWCK